MRLVVAMTGATGAPIGVRLLEALRELDVETHLVVSRWARATLAQETPYSLRDVQALASVCHGPDDQGRRSPADRSGPTAWWSCRAA